MNKYYTPELSELCVGFEYQRYMERDFDEGSCIWEDKIFPEEGLCTGTIEHPNIVEIFYENYLEGVRVKYLDQQDIVECGFVRSMIHDTDIYHLFTDIVTREGNTDKIMYVLYKEFDNKYSIAKGYYLEGWPPPCADIILFHGDIKNKTELKKLLKMLGL